MGINRLFRFWVCQKKVRLVCNSSVLANLCRLVSVVLLVSATTGYADTDAKAKRERLAQDEKALANSFSLKNEKQRAAELYLHALQLAPHIFRNNQKIAIAKLLVAVKRKQDAIALLQNVVKEPHQGFAAELYLAKLLSSNEENEKGRVAEFYLNTLKLAPQKFNYDKKISIAKLLIKANRKRDAIDLLKNIVTEPHRGFTAELALSKLLAQTGEYEAALNEANEILQRDRNNSGALLVKGSSLRRRKAFGDSIQAYRAILNKADDFDARLGLVYSLLAVGQKQEAEKHFKLLHAQDQWQQSDYEDLVRNIAVNVRPVIEYVNTTFSDSENYTGDVQDLIAKGNYADWDVSLLARHRTTMGDGISAIADTNVVYVGKHISESLRVSAGLGVINLSWQQGTSAEHRANPYTVSEFHLNALIWNGNAKFSYTSQAMTANAFLIHNLVGMTRSEVVYKKPINKALTVRVKYRNSKFTNDNDDNSAQEFEGLMMLALNRSAPQFSLGYSYRNLNFRQPTTQGYFDPQDYQAHKIHLLAVYEQGPFYLYAEYVVGNQTYKRKQQEQDDQFDHVGITTGATLWRGFRVELSTEQNNSKAAVSNYAYGDSSISLRLSYSL